MGRPGGQPSVLIHLDGHRVTLADPHPHPTPRPHGGRKDQSGSQYGATRTSTVEPHGRTMLSRAPRDSTYSSSGRALPSSSPSPSLLPLLLLHHPCEEAREPQLRERTYPLWKMHRANHRSNDCTQKYLPFLFADDVAHQHRDHEKYNENRGCDATG